MMIGVEVISQPPKFTPHARAHLKAAHYSVHRAAVTRQAGRQAGSERRASWAFARVRAGRAGEEMPPPRELGAFARHKWRCGKSIAFLSRLKSDAALSFE